MLITGDSLIVGTVVDLFGAANMTGVMERDLTGAGTMAGVPDTKSISQSEQHNKSVRKEALCKLLSFRRCINKHSNWIRR